MRIQLKNCSSDPYLVTPLLQTESIQLVVGRPRLRTHELRYMASRSASVFLRRGPPISDRRIRPNSWSCRSINNSDPLIIPWYRLYNMYTLYSMHTFLHCIHVYTSGRPARSATARRPPGPPGPGFLHWRGLPVYPVHVLR